MNSELKKEKLFSRFHFKSFFKTFFYEAFSRPFYLITHPIKGFDEFKREKTSRGDIAIFYLVMMIITQIVAYNKNGFLVNLNNPDDFNLFLTIALVIFPVFIITIANWSSTVLMDGKGTMKEIFRVICYAFFPFVWLGLFSTILSNFITVDEIIFFQFFTGLGTILLGYMVFFGLMGIHEYGLLKNIFMVFATIVAIAVILFIMLLFLSLIQQVYSYIASVYKEFVMRFL
ncbi:MAG: Yip1 family protein [Bacilli bacterium]|nr:Yip1 family protein [Bacilli bacterium]